ncbi:mucin-binding protein [Limosilactobacillus kribbianus]|uniref:mucin-binding protein n=1 Tax=Limosilactobacillus kribbianus TaxID=2982695 RepID=UPI0034CEDB1B
MHSHRVPHYGLRKLGIGVTSVLLGTTLYFGANAPAANADTVSGNEANGNAGVNVTPNSAATNVESGQSVVLGQASQNSVAPQTATASSSTAPTSQAVISQNATQSANSAVTNTPVSASTTPNLQSSAAGSSAQNTNSSAANTTTLNVASANPVTGNQVKASLAENSANYTVSDVSGSFTGDWAGGAYKSENFGTVGLKMSLTLANADTSKTGITTLKAGTTINIAKIKSTSSNGKLFNFWNHGGTHNVYYSANNKLIGQVVKIGDGAQTDISLVVKNDIVAQGAMKLSFDFDDFALLNYQTDQHIYKNDEPFYETISLTDNDGKTLNTYKYTIQHSSYSDKRMGTDAVNPYPSTNSAQLQDYEHHYLIKNQTIQNEVQNGDNSHLNFQDTYKAYYRLTLRNPSNSNYGIHDLTAYITPVFYPVTSQGKMSDEYVIAAAKQQKLYEEANNLSLSQLDKLDFSGAAYSKQNDGSYLFVFHIPKEELSLSANSDVKDKLNNSATVVFDEDESKAQNVMYQYYYKNLLKDQAPTFFSAINFEFNNPLNYDTTVTMHVLDSNGNEKYSGNVQPSHDNSKTQTQATLNINYINIKNGKSLGWISSSHNPGSINSNIDVSANKFPGYKIVNNPPISGQKVTFANGGSITLNDSNIAPSITENAKTISVSYPKNENEVSNVYIFYAPEQQKAKVIYQDVTDSNHIKNLDEDDVTGSSDDSSNYTTLNKIKDLSQKGYKIQSDEIDQINQDGTVKTYGTITFDHDNTKDQIYHVKLVHKLQPVSQQNTITRDVTYSFSDGTSLSAHHISSPAQQKVTFTGTGTRDLVTGKYVETDSNGNPKFDKDGNELTTNGLAWTPATQTFAEIKSPLVAGYTPSSASAQAITVKPGDGNYKETIVYTPDQTIQSVTVNYLDDSEGGKVLQKVQLAGPENGDAKYTTKDTIVSLQKAGYILNGDDTNGNDLKYDGKTYTVHFLHNIVPVDANNPEPNLGKDVLQKTVTRTINYVQSNGKIGDTEIESVTFNGSGMYDKTTGQLVNVTYNKGVAQITGPGTLTWTPGKTFDAVVSPAAVAGEHIALVTPNNQADGTNVKALAVDHNSENSVVNVYYVKDDVTTANAQTSQSTQRIHFIDQDGNTLLPDNVQTISFTRTPDTINHTTNQTTPGKWNKTGDTYGMVTVPTLSGYTTTKKTVGGGTVKPGDKDTEITIVYKKNGSLIPVDQNGNPIKGAPTPQYPTDPTDPTKVKSDEVIPTIPGYRPADGQSTTITPTDPVQNTNVRYTNEQVAVVEYIDATSGNILATSGPIYGESNGVINYSTKNELAALGAQGYKVVSNNFDTQTPQMFDHDVYTQQNYRILLSKQNSQGSQTSQGSQSQGSETSQGSQSQGSQTSQGSESQGSQTSQGSESQGSQTSQGSQSQGSETSQGSGSQGSQTSQGSQSQGSQTSQGSESQGSQTSQGSESQGSQTSQGSQSQGSQTSQGSQSQGSQTSQGSQSQGSQTSQGSQSQGSQTSQGSESQGSQTSQGSQSQGSQTSQGSQSQGSQTSQGSQSQGSQTSQGSQSQGSRTSQGSQSQGSQTSQGSQSQGSETSQGSESQGSQTSQGSQSQGSETSQGSQSQGSQTSQGSESQGSESQGSQTSQGSQSQGSETSQGSESQGSQTSQGSQSQGSQTSQGSESQGSETSQGSQSQGSETSQGSQSQGSETSQGSQSQGSQTSQGSQSQGRETSQGSQSQGSQTSQGSQSQGNETSQGSQISQGSESQGSETSQGSQSEGSETSQSSQSQGSQTSQGSESQGSQTSQGSESQGSQTSQGSQSQGSETSQGSESQGSETSQGSQSQGSETSQGSQSQGSQTSQGSESQGSETSQGSESQGSQTSQGSQSQGSETSQGSESQGSETSQGSQSQGSETSQGSQSQGSQTSQGSESQGSETSQGSESQGSQTSQGSQSQGSETSQGSESQGSQPSQGSQSQGSQTSQGSQSQGSQTSQGSQSQGSQPSQGSESQGSQPSQGSQSQGSQTSQGSQSQGSQTSQGSQSQGNQTSQGSQSQGSQSSQTPTADTEKVVIKYVDPDGNPITTDTVTGKSGQPINYDQTKTITDLENKGYDVTNITNPTTGQNFDNNPSVDQTYTVTVKHGTAQLGPNDSHESGTPINPNDPNSPKWPAKDTYSKDYTYTVHFVGPNGETLTGDNVQTSTWTRTVTVDKVTGKVISGTDWTPSQKKYSDVQVPVVDGYYTTQKTITGQPTVQKNISTTVSYQKLGQIVPVDQNGKQVGTGQTYQNDPNDPTKIAENQTVPSVNGYTPTTSTVTPTNPGENTTVTYTKNGDNGSTTNGGNTTNTGQNTNNGQNSNGSTNGGQSANSTTNGSSTTNDDQNANGNTGSNQNTTAEQGTSNGTVAGNGTYNGNTAANGQLSTGTNGQTGNGGGYAGTVANGLQGQAASTVSGTSNAASNGGNNITLPQTGNDTDTSAILAAAGIELAGALGLAGLAAKKKREN